MLVMISPTPEASMLKTLWTEEEGVTALEYGLIAALIAVVIIAAVKALGTKTSSTFDTVQQQMP
jgi:pilus assembly protein Flp/PilA